MRGLEPPETLSIIKPLVIAVIFFFLTMDIISSIVHILFAPDHKSLSLSYLSKVSFSPLTVEACALRPVLSTSRFPALLEEQLLVFWSLVVNVGGLLYEHLLAWMPYYVVPLDVPSKKKDD